MSGCLLKFFELVFIKKCMETNKEKSHSDIERGVNGLLNRGYYISQSKDIEHSHPLRNLTAHTCTFCFFLPAALNSTVTFCSFLLFILLYVCAMLMISSPSPQMSNHLIFVCVDPNIIAPNFELISH